MTARKAPADPAATVRPQEYAAGTGWQVGDTAPADAYRALSSEGDGSMTGPVLHEHPGGSAVQIAVKGQKVTQGVRRDLDAGEAADESDEG